MKKVIESTNLEEQLTRHHEGDSDYTHQGTGSSKKVLIAAVCLTLGYAVIEVGYRRFLVELTGFVV